MADSQIPRQKRVGNYYIPDKLRLLEREIADRYASGASAKALAAEYGVSKTGIQSAARRCGVPVRGKKEAADIYRTVDKSLTADEIADTRSIAQQVAERLGYVSSEGLSYDRGFQTACTREYRRRFYDRYREVDSKRKKALNRIPAWQARSEIEALYATARELGLEVDHIIPLQGENISGLNVLSNLQLLTTEQNQSKQNSFWCGYDPLIVPFAGPQVGPQFRTMGD